MRLVPLRAFAPAAALALAACAATPDSADRGVHVTPKANRNYSVDGRTYAFGELEAAFARERPTRIVLETSRQRKGAACIVMLGMSLGVPVWTRSLNGAMREVRSDLAEGEIGSIDECR